MTADSLFTRSFRVGRWTVTMTLPRNPRAAHQGTALATWSPEFPQSLSRAEVDEYRCRRDAVLEAYASETGMRVLVAEIGAGA